MYDMVVAAVALSDPCCNHPGLDQKETTFTRFRILR